MNENLEKVELTKEEIDTSKTWFFTIFEIKNNKPIVTENTVWESTENHVIVYWIMEGLLWVIKPTESKELQGKLLDFIDGKNNKLEKDKEDIENFQKMFKEFNEKYRILIG